MQTFPRWAYWLRPLGVGVLSVSFVTTLASYLLWPGDLAMGLFLIAMVTFIFGFLLYTTALPPELDV